MKEYLTFLFRDVMFWTLLKIFWEPFSQKRSHWWHWIDTHGNIDLTLSLSPDPDPQAKSRQGFWPNLWQTNFGWHTVYVFSPFEDDVPFYIGFVCGQTRQLCSMLIPANTDVGVLLGPERSSFFAIDQHGRQLRLEELHRISKRHLRYLEERVLLL